MTQVLPPPPTAAARSGRWSHGHLGAVSRAVSTTLLGPALVAAAAAGGMAMLQVVDPNEPGHYPSCPFLVLTGAFCPGCGSMRMLHHLGDGDVVAAFWMNPMGFLLLPVLLAYWLQWTWRVATGRPRGAPLAPWVVWTFLALVVAYWVLRNVPGLELLAPG